VTWYNVRMMEKIRFSPWTIPLVLLIICVLAFGLLIPGLGFYWDDWTVVYLTRSRGIEGLKELFAYDRPFSIWEYILTNWIAGTNPFKRQILGLVVRWGVSVALCWALYGLWQKQLYKVTWIVALFAVYPLFFQQPVALTYTHPLIVYGLFCFSLGAMIWAIRKPRFDLLLSLLALGAFITHIVTVEYYVGLELVRPIALWFALEDTFPERKQRVRQLLKRWIPYLLLFLLFIIWRLLFVTLPENTNAPVLLYDLAADPITTIVQFLQNALSDWIFSLVITWNKTLQITEISLTDRFLILTWMVVFLTTVMMWFYMKHTRFQSKGNGDLEESRDDKKWIKQGLWIGGVGTIAGMFPFWVGG